MKQGDICLAHFPFTDGSAAKLRPVLIVSRKEFNNGSDIIVLPISSIPSKGDHFSIFVSTPDYSTAGLRNESSIKWSKPATIAKSVIARRLGKLPAHLLSQVCEKLNSVFAEQT